MANLRDMLKLALAVLPLISANLEPLEISTLTLQDDIIQDPPVRTDFAGCFSGAANDTQAIFVSQQLTNDMCIDFCKDKGFSVAATKINTCVCDFDFKQLIPQMALQDEPESAGPGGFCDTLCSGWSFGVDVACNGDRCCGGSTAWSVYLVSDMDATLQVARRVMKNVGLPNKGSLGRTLFCKALGVDGSNCDEAMKIVKDLQITVSSEIDPNNRRDCVMTFDEDGGIVSDCQNLANVATSSDQSVEFTVLSYKTETYYGFPASRTPITEAFKVDNFYQETVNIDQTYSVSVSTSETFSTQSSTSVSTSVSDSVSMSTDAMTSACNSAGGTISAGVEGKVEVDVMIFGSGTKTSFGGHIDGSGTFTSDNCESFSQSSTNQMTSSLTNSQTYTVGYSTTNTNTEKTDYTVSVNVLGGCSATVIFYEQSQKIRQQWSSLFSAFGNILVDVRNDVNKTAICDTTQLWCQNFQASLGQYTSLANFVKDFKFTALGVTTYDDVQSISADISMTDVNDYSKVCQQNPHYHDQIYVNGNNTEYVDLVTIIPKDSWAQGTCNDNVRFLRSVQNANFTGELSCARNNFDVPATTCRYKCLNNAEFFHSDPPTIPINTDSSTTGIEILEPPGVVQDDNLCRSYKYTDVVLDCPCPKNYHRDTYGKCSVNDYVEDMDYINSDPVSISPNCQTAISDGKTLKYTGQLDIVSNQDNPRSGSGRLTCSNNDSLESDFWTNGAIPDDTIATLTICDKLYGKCKSWTGNFKNNLPDCQYGFDYDFVECQCDNNSHFNPVTQECTDKWDSPKGLISLWSGSLSDIPVGWALCDGNNGTPNMINRFVMGTNSESSIGTLGGSSTHTLTKSNLPSHTHTYQNDFTGRTTYNGDLTDSCRNMGGYGIPDNSYSIAFKQNWWAGESSNDYDIYRCRAYAYTSTDGGQPSPSSVNHLPPYYQMAYIMKMYNS